MYFQDILDGSRRPYGPSLEKASPNAFLVDEPKDILRAGTYNQVPLITGYCDAEGILGIFWAAQHSRQPVHKDFENFVPHTFELAKGNDKAKKVAQKVKQYYYKNEEPS